VWRRWFLFHWTFLFWCVWPGNIFRFIRRRPFLVSYPTFYLFGWCGGVDFCDHRSFFFRWHCPTYYFICYSIAFLFFHVFAFLFVCIRHKKQKQSQPWISTW
jgi:hypothetical protein